jgi:Rps23 Pro-64 3,4-dihydroxylase Tpa1-like proline 4-hydroxylase
MMDALEEFYLNPDLNLDLYAKFFREHGFVQIPDIFEQASAEAIANILRDQVPWRHLITDANNKPIHFDANDWQALTQEKRTALIESVHARARQNRGYSYYTYPMIEAILRGRDKGHPIHQMTELINSPTFLDIGRIVTGVDGITKADAHACKYEPGHFLTRHLDLGDDLERRAAYVLGFTRGWQPDWGGLLLFLKDNQDIDFGFLPRFNNLTIFDIKFLHTVTQVSTFAGELRLTITGWFRDDPPPRPA